MKTRQSELDNKRLTPIRRANVCLLAKPKGATARLAEAMGLSHGPIGSVKSDSERSIGHDFARRLETAVGLPAGWLDQPHSPSDVPAAVLALLSRSARGSRRGRAVLGKEQGLTTSRSSNPNDRPLGFELSVWADDRLNVARRLRLLADLLEAGKIGTNVKGTTGGNGDDAEYLFTTAQPAPGATE